MNRKNFIPFTVLVIASLVIAFAGGYLTRMAVTGQTTDFKILTQSYGILANHGLKPLPAAPSLEYGMIRGMLDAYADPATIFVEPVQHELESNALQGSFGGIGVRLVRGAEGDTRLYPFPEGPAAAAGVMDADLLLQVDKRVIDPDLSLDDVNAALRGPEGKKVEIMILREPAGDELSFSIQRASEQLPSVTWYLLPDERSMGMIEVNLFAASTSEEIITAVKNLEDQGATRFLLDLRDNRGGLLDAGVNTARLFLESGVVLEEQYRGQNIESFSVKAPGPLSKIQLAVLINGNTASAAEIVAGALQKEGRARLIGTPSYGKDTIQLVFNLQDGSSLHVTAARWWIPELVFPKDGHGLEPDLVIEGGDEDIDQIVQAAVADLLNGQD